MICSTRLVHILLDVDSCDESESNVIAFYLCTDLKGICAEQWLEFGQALGSGALKNLKVLEFRGLENGSRLWLYL
jgi:hypothetical protein